MPGLFVCYHKNCRRIVESAIGSVQFDSVSAASLFVFIVWCYLNRIKIEIEMLKRSLMHQSQPKVYRSLSQYVCILHCALHSMPKNPKTNNNNFKVNKNHNNFPWMSMNRNVIWHNRIFRCCYIQFFEWLDGWCRTSYACLSRNDFIFYFFFVLFSLTSRESRIASERARVHVYTFMIIFLPFLSIFFLHSSATTSLLWNESPLNGIVQSNRENNNNGTKKTK